MIIKSATKIVQTLLWIALFFIMPAQAHVLQSKDAKAHKWFDEQNYTKAAIEFKSPAWKGVSWYKAGDYAKAVEQLKDEKEVTSLYNLGNAYAKMGKYPEAVSAYDEVLKKEPNHEDASYNKKLVLSQMDKNQEKNPQKSNQDESQKSDQDNQKKNDQNNDQSKDGSKDNKGKDGSQSDSEQEDVNNGPEDKSEPELPKDNPSDTKKNEPESTQEDENNSSNQNERENVSQKKPDEKNESQDNKDKKDDNQGNQSKIIENDKLSPEQENKWLSRIQDDPGGLLRRKFQYQYLASEQEVDEGEPAW